MKNMIAGFVLALGLIVSCSSCIKKANIVTYEGYNSPRDMQEFRSEVRVFLVCATGNGIGTGVAISKNEVLTADHMTHCPDGSDPQIYVGNKAGDVIEMVVKKHGSYDVATLLPKDGSSPFDSFSPVRTNPVLVGETVCAVVGDDTVYGLRKCGDVAKVDDEGFLLSVHVVPGNSGGPIYDENGYVVGIVSRGRWFEGSEYYGLMMGYDQFKDVL